jgi:hypothetical protein
VCFIFISFGAESSDNDNWMEDALLHGINAANVHVGQQGTRPILTVTLGQPLDGRERDGNALDQSDRSYKSSGSAPSRRRRISKELQQDFFLKHMGSDGNGKISVSELEEATRQSYKSHNADPFLQQLRKRREGKSNIRRKDEEAVAERRTFTLSTLEAMEELMQRPRRITLTNLTDQDNQLSAFLQEHFNNSRNKDINLPPDAFSNIPVLPLVKTYKVIKRRSDEPAGLFLTKAKNGAVLVVDCYVYL